MARVFLRCECQKKNKRQNFPPALTLNPHFRTQIHSFSPKIAHRPSLSPSLCTSISTYARVPAAASHHFQVIFQLLSIDRSRIKIFVEFVWKLHLKKKESVIRICPRISDFSLRATDLHRLTSGSRWLTGTEGGVSDAQNRNAYTFSPFHFFIIIYSNLIQL
ncbi:hypothetical protein HanPI659440_Chr14g0554831 [Helianthus annuus]|nr:hypothetical protein HanPI659440_Chr14g0554831 [Helianthus annuus]